MRERKTKSHRLDANFALLVLFVLLPSGLISLSAAQQSNRQLKIDGPSSATKQRRIALVIGNGAYRTVKPLKNPPNDASLLATTLKNLGFDVTLATDRSQREMKQLIRSFGQQLRSGGGVGLFYFAGHGVQARGRNFLIPVDADIQTEADLEDSAVDVNYVLGMMDDAQNALNIAILDACRNNPFARSFRSAGEGLAQVKAPTGTLIAYATAPDSVAADGGGANSPYAEELVKQMQTSGVLLETMFRRVAEQVSSRSGGRQEPWYSANVKGDFYFSGSSNSSNSAGSRIDPVAVQREYWETIRNSTDPSDFKDYLTTYPNGAYAGIARSKIRQLEASGNASSKTGESAKQKPTEPVGSNSANTTIPAPLNTRSFEFVTVTIARDGTVKSRSNKTASFFTEDLGGGVKLEMVAIPPGEFMMGSPATEVGRSEDEGPQHRVRRTLRSAMSVQLKTCRGMTGFRVVVH